MSVPFSLRISITDSLAALNFKLMKRSIYILLITVVYAVAGCTDIDKANPYDDQLHTLQVTAVYPDTLNISGRE